MNIALFIAMPNLQIYNTQGQKQLVHASLNILPVCVKQIVVSSAVVDS